MNRCLPPILVVLFASMLVLAGCGGTEGERQAPPADAEPATTTPEPAPATTDAPSDAALERQARRPAGEGGLRMAADRARIVASRSEFGTVLFDANGQVVYAFENDRPNRSNCTSSDCVKAWPPVLTRRAPSAGSGITRAELGTIRREDGSLQVTYHGRPLYFYEHEAPGEIRCHDVDLHGGTWWVVTPDGANAA